MGIRASAMGRRDGRSALKWLGSSSTHKWAARCGWLVAQLECFEHGELTLHVAAGLVLAQDHCWLPHVNDYDAAFEPVAEAVHVCLA